MFTVGTRVSQYQIVEPLGCGAMGVVYKAIDETLQREVAIKVLNAECSVPQAISRFQGEASASARLNHPAIAAVYELFRNDGELMMVMEFVRGETLEEICGRVGPIPVDDAVHCIDQVLSALEHAHAAGVVHGDIKPANIMVTRDGAIKITDFGTARVVNDEEPNAADHVMGTPAYMAPEQLLGESVDPRADLYAVGVTFYRMLTGTLPFVADTTFAMAQKQLSEAPALLRVKRDGLPDWCELIVKQALAKAREDRFPTAQHFREALRTSAGWATIAPRRPLALICRASNAPCPVAAAQPSLATTAVLTLGPQWSPAGIATLGVIAATVIAGGLYVTTIREGHSIEPPGAPRTAMLEPVPSDMASAAHTTDSDLERAPAKTRDDKVTGRDARSETVHATRAAPETPLFFAARLLENDGAHSELRDCEVVLANGAIEVRDPEHGKALRVVPYDYVLSISYSHGRDPLRPTPKGPVPIARVSAGIRRLMYGSRHWVTLQTRNTRGSWIVLQFAGNKEQVSAMAALERRTRRKIEALVNR